MTAVLWFAAGVLVGVNMGLLHAWLTLRRANRKTDAKVARRLAEADAIETEVREHYLDLWERSR